MSLLKIAGTWGWVGVLILVCGCGGSSRPTSKPAEVPAALNAGTPEKPEFTAIQIKQYTPLPLSLTYEEFRDFRAHFPFLVDEYLNTNSREVVLWIHPVALEDPALTTIVSDWQWTQKYLMVPTLSRARYSSEGHWDLRDIQIERSDESVQVFTLKDWKVSEEWIPVHVGPGERIKVRFSLGYDVVDSNCPLERVTKNFIFSDADGEPHQTTLTSDWSFDGFVIRGGLQRRYRTSDPSLGTSAEGDLITSYFGGAKKQVENGVVSAPPFHCQGHVPLFGLARP